MTLELRHSVWAAAVGAVLLVASSSSPSSVARRSAVDPAPVARATTPAPPSAGRQWLTATRAVLDDAREVQVPFAEQTELGRGEAAAAAFAFDALGGQRLEVRLDGETLDGARIYVDVFRVVEVLGQPLREHWQAGGRAPSGCARGCRATARITCSCRRTAPGLAAIG